MPPILPIPPLPDEERRTRYTISPASADPVEVGFDIYGSGTDPTAWIEVYVDGVLYEDWTLSSDSGPLNTIARPITDAEITPDAAWSGVIDIVAAERPYRTVQLQEGRPVDPRTFNFAVTQLTARQREAFDRFERTIKMPFGDEGYIFPFAADRAGTVFGFDADGNVTLLTPAQNITQAVRYDIAQSLTDGQQDQALANLADGDVTWLGAHNWVKENTTVSFPFAHESVPVGSGSFRIQQSESVVDSAPLLDVIRTIDHTGGTAGHVVAGMRSHVIVEPSYNSENYAFSGVFVLDNSASDNPHSENVALNATARKLGSGWTWGANPVLEDHTANPTTGSLTSEFDMYANGADNNNNRIILDAFLRVLPGQEGVWAAPTAYAGIRFSSGIGASGGTLKNGILFSDLTFTKLIAATAAASITDGIDFSAATISGNAFKSTGFNVSGSGALTATTGTFNGNVGVTGEVAVTGAILAGSGQAASAFLYAAGNNNGARPALTPAAAIGYNYNGGEASIDFWNTYYAGSPTRSFVWRQMTGASAHTDLMSLSPAGALAAVGSMSGTAFIPTGSAVPTNGMYLPSANVLAFARNSAEFMRITADGLGIGGAPGSGCNLQVTHATLAIMRLLGNGVDFRMSAFVGAAIFGTYSNDDFAFFRNGVEVSRVDSSGFNLVTGKAYRINSVQVVGARNTGWTAQTATPSKGDLGAAPTVGQLAAWAAAVQAALTTHGLIGA